MDTVTLVDRQIEDGLSFLSQLKKDRFVFRAAFWAKPVEESRWLLYLVTPAKEKMGSLAANGSVLQSLRSVGDVSFRGSDVITLISEKSPVAKGVLDLQKRFPDVARTRLSQSVFGDKVFAEVYIYPQGEVEIPIYGLFYRGEPTGALLLSFRPHNSHSRLEVESKGVRSEYPAETGMDWLVAAPEGAALEKDGLHLGWDFRGIRKQSNANEVMALADLGLHGFRILSEPNGMRITVPAQ
jgi:hypothetical protein